MRLYPQNVEKILFNWIRPIFLILLVVSLFSCSNKKSILFRTNKSQAIKIDTFESNSASQTNPKILIQAGDDLVIANLENENLINGLGVSTPLEIRYQVDEKGRIKLPGIGEVTLEGLSAKEAENYITKEYKKNTLANPLFVITIVNLKVTLLGEFSKQGNFDLRKQNTSLIDVIGDAGGFSPRADKTKTKIIRGDKKNPEVINVDLTNIASLANPKLQLKNGDIIYSQPRGIYLFTDKLNPVLSYVGIGTSLISLILLFSRR